MKILICCLLSALSTNSFAHGGGEASIEVGADKGVLAVKPDKSFRLAPEAIRRLEIKTEAVHPGNILISKKAIANSLGHAQIYRSRDGWLKGIEFKIVGRTENSVTIQSRELMTGDALVVSGVGFLRMISAQLGSVEEKDEHEGHADHSEVETHGHAIEPKAKKDPHHD